MKKATLNKKIEDVNAIASKFEESVISIVVDAKGLTVTEVSELRNDLYKVGCELKVVKNNILRRAADKMGYENIQESFVGPSAVAFSKDAGSAAKVIFDFAKKNANLEVKAGLIEGKFTKKEDLKAIAGLPNKEGMIAMLLSVMQAPIRNLGVVIKAIAEKEA
ncbi:MAG: 50S ribosomal protein L10 [Bacilli bacterium]|nr:50S ribosomal protein L10 [Bacilli bacterium]